MRPPAIPLCALVLLAACGGGSGDQDSTVKVFAASSMTDVLPEIAERFEGLSAADVELSFAGSSALREQILDGADADVFVSANRSVMQSLLDADMIGAEPVVVAGNTMTIAVPLGNPAQVTDLSDFENSSLTLGVCAPGVPCGDLASTVFENQGIEPEVDTNEANVRSLLTKVELGELDAALVYRTDVLSSGEVEEVVLPPEAALLGAQYSVGMIAGSGPDADAFIEFLQSAEAIEIFTDAGFVVS